MKIDVSCKKLKMYFVKASQQVGMKIAKMSTQKNYILNLILITLNASF